MKNKSNSLDAYFNTKEEIKLSELLKKGLVNDAISKLRIDPRNKKDIEIQKDIKKYLLDIIKKKPDIAFVVDHRSEILKESRRFQNLGSNIFACIFYAMWFEHWINNLIVIYGIRKKISENDLIQIIRESNARAKFSWILKLLDVPHLSKKHISIVLHIFDLRNS